MEEAKIANPAVFEELPLELNRPILLKWLERTLGYNYTTRALSTPEGGLIYQLILTSNPDLVLMALYTDVLLYNIQTEQIEKEFKGERKIQQIAVNDDDKTKVTIVQGKKIVLWDLSTEEKSVALEVDEDLRSIALSPDGKYILTVHDQDICLWEISKKKLVKKIKVAPSYRVLTVAFNRESNKMLTVNRLSEIVIWDLQGNKLTTFVKCSDIINCALFSPDGRSIIGGGQKGITILDANTGNIRLTNFDVGSILSLAYSPDGHTLIAGSSDSNVYVIDLKTAKVLTILENFGGDILELGFTSDGNNIISSSKNGTLCLHTRLKKEDNEWATTRKETALELYLQLLGKSPDFPLPSCYQVLQNISKDPAFQIFAILAMILAYNM